MIGLNDCVHTDGSLIVQKIQWNVKSSGIVVRIRWWSLFYIFYFIRLEEFEMQMRPRVGTGSRPGDCCWNL